LDAAAERGAATSRGPGCRRPGRERARAARCWAPWSFG